MAIPFVNLPELGATMDGGAFCGVTTTPEGKHCAVLLLTNRMGGATYDEASGWAKEIGAELPSLSVMLMVFAIDVRGAK